MIWDKPLIGGSLGVKSLKNLREIVTWLKEEIESIYYNMTNLDGLSQISLGEQTRILC